MIIMLIPRTWDSFDTKYSKGLRGFLCIIGGMKRKLLFFLIGVGLVVGIAFGVTLIPRELGTPTPESGAPTEVSPTPSVTATRPDLAVEFPQTTEAQ